MQHPRLEADVRLQPDSVWTDTRRARAHGRVLGAAQRGVRIVMYFDAEVCLPTARACRGWRSMQIDGCDAELMRVHVRVRVNACSRVEAMRHVYMAWTWTCANVVDAARWRGMSHAMHTWR